MRVTSDGVVESNYDPTNNENYQVTQADDQEGCKGEKYKVES